MPGSTRMVRPPKPFQVSLADAQAISGLSRSGVYRLLESGQLRGRKIGVRLFIEYASLEAWSNGLPAFEPGGGNSA